MAQRLQNLEWKNVWLQWFYVLLARLDSRFVAVSAKGLGKLRASLGLKDIMGAPRISRYNLGVAIISCLHPL